MTRAWTTFTVAVAIVMSELAQATDAVTQQARPDLVDCVHRGYCGRATSIGVADP
ncbi:hypothetical protein [Bradyrhizobium roseum]|uniref:hypothetical protein n=1 Tax=Bradyrhizobium roseum TaxID=3056648 RepID=UPI002604BA6F|nr:hypothetical protein [Bradyrhizobium roseus]WKA31267.1 hypothetical protein QUH67_14350 [Bradyrhizobium roseus]